MSTTDIGCGNTRWKNSTITWCHMNKLFRSFVVRTYIVCICIHVKIEKEAAENSVILFVCIIILCCYCCCCFCLLHQPSCLWIFSLIYFDAAILQFWKKKFCVFSTTQKGETICYEIETDTFAKHQSLSQRNRKKEWKIILTSSLCIWL